jgi:dynactin complex subunit
MLNQEQINKLISENDYLRVQLKEANEMLALREEEIEILEQNAGDITELRSQLEVQLNHAQSLQNIIGTKQQQAAGAANRCLKAFKSIQPIATAIYSPTYTN